MRFQYYETETEEEYNARTNRDSKLEQNSLDSDTFSTINSSSLEQFRQTGCLVSLVEGLFISGALAEGVYQVVKYIAN